MADFFVNSAAGGANDGTSKTDAWTSMLSAVAVAAGSRIFHDDGHNQNPGASGTYTFSSSTPDAPIELYSIDFADDSYSPAAAANFSGASSDLFLVRNIVWHGCFIGVADDVQFNGHGSNNSIQKFRDCVIDCGDDIQHFDDYGLQVFERCTFDSVSGTFVVLRLEDGIHCRFEDCEWTGTAGQIVSHEASQGGYVTYEDSDIAIFAQDFFGRVWDTHIVIARCEIHATVLETIAVAMVYPPDSAVIENSAAGTISVPPIGLNRHSTYWGTATGTLSVYRTGGADDGLQANPQSWEIDTWGTLSRKNNAFRTRPMLAFADAAASPSGATARGIFTTTKCQTFATPTALTTDGDSTWTGGSIDTKYKIVHTLTNGETLTIFLATSGDTLTDADVWLEISEPDQVGGPVTVYVACAKPGLKFWLDPNPVVSNQGTNRQWFAGGVQVSESGEIDWFSDGVQVSNYQAAGGGGTVLTADPGSYAITGTVASLEQGYVIGADSGSFSISGVAASLEQGYAINPEEGSYIIGGVDATLIAGDTLVADSGSYSLTGTETSLEQGYLTSIDVGTYSITGVAANLNQGIEIQIDPGSYSLTGTDADFTEGFGLSTDVGSYLITGVPASLLQHSILNAAVGVYTIIGVPANLAENLENIVGGRFIVGQVYYPGFKQAQVNN